MTLISYRRPLQKHLFPLLSFPVTIDFRFRYIRRTGHRSKPVIRLAFPSHVNLVQCASFALYQLLSAHIKSQKKQRGLKTDILCNVVNNCKSNLQTSNAPLES